MKNFDNYLIRRGLETTKSGSDCFIINFIDEYNNLKTAVGSSSGLYNNRKNLGIEFKDIYTSRSGANWASKIIKQPHNVNVFKTNSYRTDILGHVGLEFVETHYGDSELSIYLPYNYTRDTIDSDFPAYIISKRFKRVIACHPEYIAESLVNSQKYFDTTATDKSIEIRTGYESYTKFKIFDDRRHNHKSYWGSFEHPTKELKTLIRLLIRDGFLNADSIRSWNSKAYSLTDLIPDQDERDYFEESQNVLGLEIFNERIRRFTKYTNDLWIEIPVCHGGIELIKPKKPVVYKDPLDGLRELTAHYIIKMNSVNKGIYFIGVNQEYEYIFQTISYSAFDVLTHQVPEFEVESILIPDESKAE